MELVVVISIIAMLSILSVSAFINARNQAMVSSTAEHLLSTLRESQNRAISVTKGSNTPATSETKAWATRINSGDILLVHFDKPAASGIVIAPQGSALSLPSGMTITTNRVSNGATTPQATTFITYSSPFAKTYDVTNSYACAQGQPVPVACTWEQVPGSAVLDWRPTQNAFALPADKVEITINYRGATQKIVVNSKGDAYIE